MWKVSGVSRNGGLNTSENSVPIKAMKILPTVVKNQLFKNLKLTEDSQYLGASTQEKSLEYIKNSELCVILTYPVPILIFKFIWKLKGPRYYKQS